MSVERSIPVCIVGLGNPDRELVLFLTQRRWPLFFLKGPHFRK